MGGLEIEAFLTHLAVKRKASASTQNQALNAIVFLYKHILARDPGQCNAIRAKNAASVYPPSEHPTNQALPEILTTAS